MRLINCRTLELEEFIGSSVPGYAILSHTCKVPMYELCVMETLIS